MNIWMQDMKDQQQQYMQAELENLQAVLSGKPQRELHDRITDTWGQVIPLIPGYNEQHAGEWQVVKKPAPLVRGYFTAFSPSPQNFSLIRDNTCWMSLTPMELESHLVPMKDGKGKVVVAGLGLGMIAINLLTKRDVSKVVILEQSRDLIDAFPSLLEGYTKDIWDDAVRAKRVQIIPCDVTADMTGYMLSQCKYCDHLYVDTWDTLLDEDAITITQHLNRQLRPRSVSMWGQELEIVAAFNADNTARERITSMTGTEWRGLIDGHFKMPMSVREYSVVDRELYMHLCELAAYNVSQY